MNAQRGLFQDTAPTLDEVMSAWGGHSDYKSRLEIAEALGRAKSPTLIAVVGVLVGMGYLSIREVKLPNRVIMYEYAPTPKWDRDGHIAF